MKTQIYPAIKITIVLLLLLSVVYPALVWAIAQIAPNHGKGEMLAYNGQKYYRNIGQAFTRDDYFWSRPSAVGYNAAGSGGSNKGPSNGEYLSEVKARIDTFLVHRKTRTGTGRHCYSQWQWFGSRYLGRGRKNTNRSCCESKRYIGK